MTDETRAESDAEIVSEDEASDAAAPPRPRRRRVLTVVVVLVVALVVAGVTYAIYEASQSDDEAAAPTATGVQLPQNPSLKMIVEDGGVFVENDGNVTMSDVEVRDADGNPLCSLGVLSPGDRQPCEEAGDAADLVVVGSGPQGQRVERGLG